MTDEFPARGERRLALLALMRSSACVGVDVILQRGQRLKASLAHRALVRSVFRVTFHVPTEQVALRRRVIAEAAHMSLRYVLDHLLRHDLHRADSSFVGLQLRQLWL